MTRANPVEEAALRELIELNRLLSLATVSPKGVAHINTAFFAADESLTLFMLSPPGSEHARHLRGASSAAVSIYDSHQTHHERRGATAEALDNDAPPPKRPQRAPRRRTNLRGGTLHEALHGASWRSGGGGQSGSPAQQASRAAQ